MKIYICSQYRGDVEKNVERALAYCREVSLKGDTPICPHIYFTQFLYDDDEKERNLGIQLGKSLLEDCDKMNVYLVDGVVSEGMKAEIEYAKTIGKISICYIDVE